MRLDARMITLFNGHREIDRQVSGTLRDEAREVYGERTNTPAHH